MKYRVTLKCVIVEDVDAENESQAIEMVREGANFGESMLVDFEAERLPYRISTAQTRVEAQ